MMIGAFCIFLHHLKYFVKFVKLNCLEEKEVLSGGFRLSHLMKLPK